MNEKEFFNQIEYQKAENIIDYIRYIEPPLVCVMIFVEKVY